MPSNGPHSFLQVWEQCSQGVGCQCPQTGNTHFYRDRRIALDKLHKACQCPQTGNTHFYIPTVSIPSTRPRVCQCPQTGHTLFYVDEANAIMAAAKACVNALKRATLISTLQNFTVRMEDGRCQCPPTGHTHFYGMGRRPVSGKQAVSMPSNGQHSFLQTWILTYLNYLNGVNALKRATLIST